MVLPLPLTHAYVANQTGANIDKIDIMAPNTVTPLALGLTNNPQWIAITPDGTTGYITELGGTDLHILDIASDTLRGSITLPSPASFGTVEITPDGIYAFVTNFGAGTLTQVTIASGTAAASAAVLSNPLGIAFLSPPSPPDPPVSPGVLNASSKKSAFFSETDRFNIITWEPIFSTIPVTYLIYRNGGLIGSVNSPGPYQFEDHNRKKKKTDIYTVVAKTSLNSTTVGSISVTCCK
ncbi:MAG: hypothetical protein KDK96_08400 [Chlamydiia bacterium]|nr:hypothetical protein [Chlamydiia bacterium]